MSDLKNECVIQKGESIVKIFASERFGESVKWLHLFSLLSYSTLLHISFMEEEVMRSQTDTSERSDTFSVS